MVVEKDHHWVLAPSPLRISTLSQQPHVGALLFSVRVHFRWGQQSKPQKDIQNSLLRLESASWAAHKTVSCWTNLNSMVLTCFDFLGLQGSWNWNARAWKEWDSNKLEAGEARQLQAHGRKSRLRISGPLQELLYTFSFLRFLRKAWPESMSDAATLMTTTGLGQWDLWRACSRCDTWIWRWFLWTRSSKLFFTIGCWGLESNFMEPKSTWSHWETVRKATHADTFRMGAWISVEPCKCNIVQLMSIL